MSTWDQPRYRAEPPWIGPVLGGAFDADGASPVSIGAASDPLLGKAVACIWLPMVLASGSGRAAPRREAALISRIQGDSQGRFRITPPTSLRQKPNVGVLMVLLYDESSDPWHPWDLFGGTLFALAENEHKALLEQEFIPLHRLPEPIQSDVAKALESFLQQPAEHVQTALIELRGPRAAEGLTFAAASCQYPAGFLDADAAESSYRRLADKLAQEDAPACVLLLGDQIYADATAGLFDPTSLHDRFDLPHERLLRMKPLRRILRSIPAYTMLDDHEIEDNWEPNGGSEENLERGRKSYLAYQRMAGPLPASPGRLWYSFELGGFDFFMADTRTERGPRTAQTVHDACIMSKDQFGALTGWLDQCKRRDIHEGTDRPKFIASPASLLPRYARAAGSALRSDGWDGYPRSLHRLLAHIAKEEIRKVVFLSGDAHISFDAKALVFAPGSSGPVEVRSIHSSALYAPFPFGNAVEADFPRKDRFHFDAPEISPGTYVCDVQTAFAAPGDGFAVLHVEKNGTGWDVTPDFDRVK